MKFRLKEKKYGRDEASRSKMINNIRGKQMEEGGGRGTEGGCCSTKAAHGQAFPNTASIQKEHETRMRDVWPRH